MIVGFLRTINITMRTALKNGALTIFPPLRRLVRQRDELSQRLDMAVAASIKEGVRHRQFTSLNAVPAISKVSPAKDDYDIVERVVAAYRRASKNPYGEGSMWGDFFNKYQKAQHEIFMSGDLGKARQVLSNPARSNLFYGFDELCLAFVNQWHADPQSFADTCQDNLLRLAEAIGVTKLQCPEMPTQDLDALPMDANSILRLIEQRIGIQLYIPDVYPGASGVACYRGIITYRHIQSLHLAIRILDVVNNQTASVCEIGGGLGRGALFANQLGIKNYTLVDIPMTTISQGYYLMRTLGENAVVLPGEKRSSPEQVQLMHSEDFFASQDRYDLIVNVDSITELGDDLARKYAEKIAASTTQFLSINHECNNLSVNSMMREIGYQHKTRHPYWMRQGYVEELYRFS